MDYQKVKRIGRTTRHADQAQSFDARSIASLPRSQFGGDVSIPSRTRAVKNLFDSEYIRPEENHRVIQDQDPKKIAAFKEGLARYEQNLKSKNETDEKYLRLHNDRVEHDDGIKQREKDLKK